MMNASTFALVLATIDTACWVACFIWMHRISVRQDALMTEMHGQNVRIEKLAKAEHDMLKEVHPVVGEIKEKVEEIAAGERGENVERRTSNVERRSKEGRAPGFSELRRSTFDVRRSTFSASPTPA